MQYITNQNIGHTPKLGSRHDVRYIRTSDDVTEPLKGRHSRHGSRGSKGSQELLAPQPRMKNKTDLNQVVGLMDANLEALMVRDIQAQSRRASAIGDNDSRWQQRERKSKR